MPNPEQIQGRVTYRSFAAFLAEDGRESLLAMDVPPFGHIQEEDITAAFNHLSVFQGAREGTPVALTGFRDSFGERRLILIVRIESVGTNQP